MKSIVMPVSEQLKQETKEQLAVTIHETVAKENGKKNKTFTASEMWRLRRQMRSASGMLNRWNQS